VRAGGESVDAGHSPTPYPEVNALLHELLKGVQTILGNRFVGMYLDGSLASDDFDQDSDIDFVVVTDEEIPGHRYAALQAMHDRLAATDSPWAIQLEGFYLSRRAVQRHDPAHPMHPNIERGPGERLKMVRHDEGWVIHRYVLREKGITLAGPAPQSLIDPVLPRQLQQAMLTILPGWAAPILQDPDPIKYRGGQSYIVLTICRVLYTLQHGAVASKPAAARWAQETLDERWAPLIERTWSGRHNPGLKASPDEVNETVEFVRYALERSRQS
jgi:predicted nucleotidyltransferase